MVWSVLNYQAVIWGNYYVSAVNAINHGAIRLYLVEGKYALIVANNVGMAMDWILLIVRQWKVQLNSRKEGLMNM